MSPKKPEGSVLVAVEDELNQELQAAIRLYGVRSIRTFLHLRGSLCKNVSLRDQLQIWRFTERGWQKPLIEFMRYFMAKWAANWHMPRECSHERREKNLRAHAVALALPPEPQRDDVLYSIYWSGTNEEGRTILSQHGCADCPNTACLRNPLHSDQQPATLRRRRRLVRDAERASCVKCC